jgi:hypothetical protein
MPIDKAANLGMITLSTHALITPSDTVDFTQYPWTILCIQAGTAALVDSQGNVVSYPMLAWNDINGMNFRRMNATGTTGQYVAMFL